MPQPVSALLLDLDGTLVDSEPRHFRAHELFLKRQGITVTEDDLLGNIGKGDREFFTLLAERHGLSVDIPAWVTAKTEALLEIYRSEPLPRQPGVDALLDHARAEGIACCIVTSSERRVAEAALASAGLAQRLPMRVCREDTPRHKPDPGPYQLAAARLALPPTSCLVIEDSVSGVRAAVAAGIATVGFAGLIPAAALRAAGAYRAISDHHALLPLAQARDVNE